MLVFDTDFDTIRSLTTKGGIIYAVLEDTAITIYRPMEDGIVVLRVRYEYQGNDDDYNVANRFMAVAKHVVRKIEDEPEMKTEIKSFNDQVTWMKNVGKVLGSLTKQLDDLNYTLRSFMEKNVNE